MRTDPPPETASDALTPSTALPAVPFLARGFAWVAALVLCAMAMVSFADVFMRLLGRPVTGAYELTGLLMGLMVYATLPLVTASDQHVRAGVLQLWRSAPPALSRGFALLRQLMTALGMGYLAVAMARYMQRVAQAGDRAAFIEVPLAWIAGFGTTSLALSALLALWCLRQVIRSNSNEGSRP